jgi:hypothetical protein
MNLRDDDEAREHGERQWLLAHRTLLGPVPVEYTVSCAAG